MRFCAIPGSLGSDLTIAQRSCLSDPPTPPVRIASAYGDPFYPGVRTLARALPAGAVVVSGPGCHDGSFFAAQEPPSLAFLASHLA